MHSSSNPASNVKNNSNPSTSSVNLVKFFSWQWHVLLAIIPGLLLIQYTYTEYGLESVNIFERGTWLILGGFSLFYPTGGFMLVFVLALAIGFIFTLKQVILSRDASGQLVIQEKIWGIIPLTTKFDLNAVSMVRFETGRFGNKIVWMFILGTHAVYLLNDGLHLLLSPVVFGYGVENATILIVAGLVDLLMLLIILLPGENHLEIHTAAQFDVLIFYLGWKKAVKIHAMLQILNFPPASTENTSKSLEVSHSILSSKLLGYGAIFWLLALSARIFDLYAGQPLRLAFYFTGWACLLYGLKFRVSSKQSWLQRLEKNASTTQYAMAFQAPTARTYIWLKTISDPNQKPRAVLAHIPALIMIGLLAIVFLMGWTLVAWIRFTWGSLLMVGWTVVFLGLDLLVVALVLGLIFEESIGITFPPGHYPSVLKLPQLDVQKAKAFNGETDAASIGDKRFWLRWQQVYQSNTVDAKKILFGICFSVLLGILSAFF